MSGTRLLATDLDARGISRIRNAPDPVEDMELCNWRTARDLFDAAMAAIHGLNWKDDARAGYGTPIDIYSAPMRQGSVAFTDGDRILLTAQANPAQNGIWVWEHGRLERPPDANEGSLLNGAVVTVVDGDLRGQTFRQSTKDPRLGISPIVWAPFMGGNGPATTAVAGIVKLADRQATVDGLSGDLAVTPLGLSQALNLFFGGTGSGGGGAAITAPGRGIGMTIGDGINDAFLVRHPFQTRDVEVQVHSLVSGELVRAQRRVVSMDAVEVSFLQPPLTDEFRVVVVPVGQANVVVAGPGGVAQPLQVNGGVAVTIGDGVRTNYLIQHALNTRDVVVQVRRLATNEFVDVAARVLGVDSVEVEFITPPPMDSFRVLIIPV